MSVSLIWDNICICTDNPPKEIIIDVITTFNKLDTLTKERLFNPIVISKILLIKILNFKLILRKSIIQVEIIKKQVNVPKINSNVSIADIIDLEKIKPNFIFLFLTTLLELLCFN